MMLNVLIGTYQEYKDFASYLADHFRPFTPEKVKKKWKELNLYDYAEQIVVNLPYPRLEPYLQVHGKTDCEVR